MTGALTLEIQQLTRPELAELFEDLGHDLVIVQPGAPTGDFDDDGRQQQAPDTRTALRGLLMPASDRARMAAAGSDLPTPSFEAYLPHDAPVAVPGWHLEHDGIRYYPTADARDEGGQGVVWVVPLGAPGEVVERG